MLQQTDHVRFSEGGIIVKARDGSTTIPYGIDSRHAIEILSVNLYSSPTSFLRELISNSIDSTEDLYSADRRRIDVTLKDDVLSIRDLGKGMSASEMRNLLPVLFKSSKSKENRSNIGSFGIGLYSSLAYAYQVIVNSSKKEASGATEAILGDKGITLTPSQWVGPGTEVKVYLKNPLPAYLQDNRQTEGFIRDTFPFSPVDIFFNEQLTAGPSRFHLPWASPEEPAWSPFLSCARHNVTPPKILHCIRFEGEFGSVAIFLVNRPLTYDEQSIQLFVRNVLVVGKYSVKNNPAISTFLAGVINTSDMELTISRDNIIAGHPSILRLDQFFMERLAAGLAEWAEVEHDHFQDFIKAHRSSFLEACAANEVLCRAIYSHILFRSHLNEWIPLSAALVHREAFFAFNKNDLIGLNNGHDIQRPVFLFESLSEKEFFYSLRYYDDIAWIPIYKKYKSPAKGDLTFRAEQVRVFLEKVNDNFDTPDLSLGEYVETFSNLVSVELDISEIQVVNIPTDQHMAWFAQGARQDIDKEDEEEKKAEEAEVQKELKRLGAIENSMLFKTFLQFYRNEILYKKILFLNYGHPNVVRFYDLLDSSNSDDMLLTLILFRAFLAVARNSPYTDSLLSQGDIEDRLVLESLINTTLDAARRVYPEKTLQAKGDDEKFPKSFDTPEDAGRYPS